MLGSTNTWKNNLSEHVPTLSMRMLMQPAGGAPGPGPSRAVAWTMPITMVIVWCIARRDASRPAGVGPLCARVARAIENGELNASDESLALAPPFQ